MPKSSASSASQSRRPSVLWLMTDEQRCDSLGCYDSPWARTPNVDEFARRGVRFDAAYTPSPVCVAARAAILTARSGSTTGVLNNHLPLPAEHAVFLTEQFAQAGYQTASFGKHHYNSSKPAFQVQAGCTLGDRVHYEKYLVDVDEDALGVVRYPADETNRAFPWILAGRFPGAIEDTPEACNIADALAWLQNRNSASPFFLRISLNAPHTPVVAPQPYDAMIDPESIGLPIDEGEDLQHLPAPFHEYLIARSGCQRLTRAQILRSRQVYYGAAAFVDELFGRLLDGMRSHVDLADTIVVYMSDHGTHLGDHGFYQKQSFLDPSARVPLIVALPGQDTGYIVPQPVSTGSLLPTLLDLAGLSHDDADYASLADVLKGEAPPRGPVVSEIDYGLWQYRTGERYVMIRDGKWKLALYRDDDPMRHPSHDDGRMLFDMEADPGERNNLACEPQYADVIEQLIATLDASDARRRQRHGLAS